MKVEKHILPVFSGLTYSALSAQLVHEFIRKKPECGLSPKYVSDIIRPVLKPQFITETYPK